MCVSVLEVPCTSTSVTCNVTARQAGHTPVRERRDRPTFRCKTLHANFNLQTDACRRAPLRRQQHHTTAIATTSTRAVSDARPTRGCDDEAWCSWIHRCYGSVWRSNGSGRVVLWHSPCWLFYDVRVTDQRVMCRRHNKFITNGRFSDIFATF